MSNVTARKIPRWIDHFVVVGPLRPFFQNPRKVLRDYIDPGMTVLDIGCGQGFFSLEMARMVGSGGRAVCVDLKTEAIEHLKAKAKKAGLSDRVDTHICNDHNLGIDDLSDQIDFALAFYVLHHAADIRGLMAQVQGALKPGGRFLIVEPSHHASAEYCGTVKSAAQQAGFSISGNPKLIRNWTILLIKN
jgi:ubiquinone/menaquinone biosynthesis C-methylase UbiE